PSAREACRAALSGVVRCPLCQDYGGYPASIRGHCMVSGRAARRLQHGPSAAGPYARRGVCCIYAWSQTMAHESQRAGGASRGPRGAPPREDAADIAAYRPGVSEVQRRTPFLRYALYGLLVVLLGMGAPYGWC